MDTKNDVKKKPHPVVTVIFCLLFTMAMGMFMLMSVGCGEAIEAGIDCLGGEPEDEEDQEVETADKKDDKKDGNKDDGQTLSIVQCKSKGAMLGDKLDYGESGVMIYFMVEDTSVKGKDESRLAIYSYKESGWEKVNGGLTGLTVSVTPAQGTEITEDIVTKQGDKMFLKAVISISYNGGTINYTHQIPIEEKKNVVSNNVNGIGNNVAVPARKGQSTTVRKEPGGEPPQAARLSDNAALSSVTLFWDGIDRTTDWLRDKGKEVTSFKADSLEYNLCTTHDLSHIEFRAVLADKSARITKQGVENGKYKITVLAQDGKTTRTYSFGQYEPDARLKSVEVLLAGRLVENVLEPGFDPETVDYRITLNDANKDNTVIKGTCQHKRAKIAFEGIEDGAYVIEVQAEDNETTKKYRFTFPPRPDAGPTS